MEGSFAPAIYYAEHGYAVPEIIHDYWASAGRTLKSTAEAQRVFLPTGNVPQIGEMFSNPDLAKALRLIAENGPDAFYRGEIAKAILKTSSELGGTMQADDLAKFSSEWVAPISINYRGWKVYELPPNGQGMAALEMLNIMATSQPSKDGPSSTTELHKKRSEKAGLHGPVPLQWRTSFCRSAGDRVALRRIREGAGRPD